MKKYNLLFMGDSLTAGVYSDGMLDYRRNSYPKFIMQYYKKKKLLRSYHNIAVSGFTTKDVLNILKEDLTYNQNVAFNITPEQTYRKLNYRHENTVELLLRDVKISTLIKQADIITMTLGSNDIIRYLNSYRDEIKKINVKQLIQEEDKKDILLKDITNNFKEIINYINSINKQCKIAIYTSYTPIKYDLVNKILDKYLRAIETEILNSLKEYENITIIDIRDEVSSNKKEYIDNPFDIHLNEQGYKFMADKFISTITNGK